MDGLPSRVAHKLCLVVRKSIVKNYILEPLNAKMRKTRHRNSLELNFNHVEPCSDLPIPSFGQSPFFSTRKIGTGFPEKIGDSTTACLSLEPFGEVTWELSEQSYPTLEKGIQCKFFPMPDGSVLMLKVGLDDSNY